MAKLKLKTSNGIQVQSDPFVEYHDRLAETFQSLTHSTSEWCGQLTLHISFQIPKKSWDEYRKTVGLGTLYGIDLSNYLSRKGMLNFYAMPIVSDKSRAKNGIKHISVTFSQRGGK